MKGTWKCPSLCDEDKIQNPIYYIDNETIINGKTCCTLHCPLCGKELMWSLVCDSRSLAGFLVSPINPQTESQQDDPND